MNKLWKYIVLVVLISVVLIALTFIVLTNYPTQRWEIHQTEMGYHDKDGNPKVKENAILIDTKSGDTWILWTGPINKKDIFSNYFWEKLEKKEKTK